MSSTLALQPNVIGVVNAQIAPVTANSSTAYTIGTVLPLPQLKQLTVTVKSIEKEAIAGFTLVDSFTIKQAYDVKFENVNIPLDVMAAINGATLLQNGTAPSQINSVVDASTDVPILFNLSFDTTDGVNAPSEGTMITLITFNTNSTDGPTFLGNFHTGLTNFQMQGNSTITLMWSVNGNVGSWYPISAISVKYN